MFDVLNLYLHHHVSAEIILVQQFKKKQKKTKRVILQSTHPWISHRVYTTLYKYS